MKFGRMLALSLATLLIAVPAVHAQDDMGDMATKRPRKKTVEEENNDPSRSGPMLGLSANYNIDNFSGTQMSTGSSFGFAAHVGYRFNKWVSSELRMDRFVQFDGNAGGVDVGEVNGWYLGLDQKAYLLHGRYQPIVLVGLGMLTMDTSNSAAANNEKTDDGVSMRFGGGIDLYATNKIVVTGDVSYVLGLGEVDGYGVTVIGLGFNYRP